MNAPLSRLSAVFFLTAALLVAVIVYGGAGLFLYKLVAHAQPPLYSFGLTITRTSAPTTINAVVSTTTQAECEYLRQRAWLLRLKQLVPGRPDTYGDDPQIAVVQTTPQCKVAGP